MKCKNCKWGRSTVKWTHTPLTDFQKIMGSPNLAGKKNIVKCNRLPESIEKEEDDYCSLFENAKN